MTFKNIQGQIQTNKQTNTRTFKNIIQQEVH
jgi:hypothetical protein